MADNINKLRDDLEALEKQTSDLAANIGKSFEKGFTSATNSTKDLIKEFDKGSNITKKLDSEMRKLKNSIDSSYNLETKLNEELAKQLAKGGKRASIKADSIKKQITELQNERNLNIELEYQLRELEKLNAKRKEGNDLSKIFNLDQIKSKLTLVAIFKTLIDSGLNFSKVSANIGKNIGYGADNANRVASNLVKVAQSATNSNVTLQNVAEAMNELATATGFVAEYSADALETQIMLTKQFGLQADEAAGIYKFSVLTGKSSKAVNDAMVGAFVATRNSLRVGVPFRAAIAEAAKVSGQLAANLQNNPEQIVKAVVQAKALGTTLEQVRSQGESLLNFETSIENQLKAELITGQQLNLERARAAALMGDQVTLAQELSNQGMTLEKFQSMNVIAQRSFAEALGLSADQLADQLQKQKLAIESGKSLAQITEEEAKQAQQRQDAQTKFNTAIEKLQDMIGNLVAGPLGMMLEMFSKVLSNSISLGAVLGGVVAVNLFKTIGMLKEAGKISRTTAITEIISAAFKSTGWIPLVGMALAGALAGAGIAYLSSQTSKADDIISPGYGQRAIVSPEGTIALNNRDTIVAGTNLAGGGMDLNSVVSAIKDLKQTLMTRPAQAFIQGENAFVSNITTKGVQNTYKSA